MRDLWYSQWPRDRFFFKHFTIIPKVLHVLLFQSSTTYAGCCILAQPVNTFLKKDCSMESIVAVCSISNLAFVMETQYAFCEVGKDFLNTT